MSKICAHCGSQFSPSGCGNRKYCTQACSCAARKLKKSATSISTYAKLREEREARIINCHCCGKQYRRPDGFPKYCSIECRKKSCGSAASRRRRAAISGVYIGKAFSFFDVYERDGGKCSICNVSTPIELRGTIADNAPHLDHIIPISRGGHHALYNSQIACLSCNIKKGNKISAIDLDRALSLWPEPPQIISGRPRRARRNSQSGVRGVFFDKAHNTWIAAGKVEGQYTRLRFKDKQKAVAARKEMDEKNAVKKKISFDPHFEWYRKKAG